MESETIFQKAFNILKVVSAHCFSKMYARQNKNLHSCLLSLQPSWHSICKKCHMRVRIVNIMLRIKDEFLTSK